jgi:hypothetical protein
MKGNAASLLPGKIDADQVIPVIAYRPVLVLRRNIDSVNPFNPKLVYQCAPVVRPETVTIKNDWVKPLSFQGAGSLKTQLEDFFLGLYPEVSGEAVDWLIHVVPSLQFCSGGLKVVDSFSQVPTDFMATDPKKIAGEIFKQLCDWLDDRGIQDDIKPLEGPDEANLVLRIQITNREFDHGKSGRTLLNINSVSFALPTKAKSLVKRRKH